MYVSYTSVTPLQREKIGHMKMPEKMKIYFHTEAYTQMFRVVFSHNS